MEGERGGGGRGAGGVSGQEEGPSPCRDALLRLGPPEPPPGCAGGQLSAASWEASLCPEPPPAP